MLGRLKRNLTAKLRLAIAPRPTHYPAAVGVPTIVGLFNSASGIGESARLCLAAFRELRLPANAIDLTARFHGRDNLPYALPALSNAANSGGPLILHLNPPELPAAMLCLGKKVIEDRFIVGYWAWELEE